MTNSTVTGVILAAFLVLAFTALLWAVKQYRKTLVRSYQRNELDIADPIAFELKKLAIELSNIQENADIAGEYTKAHVAKNVKIKREFIRLGQELKLNSKDDSAKTSSFEQKI